MAQHVGCEVADVLDRHVGAPAQERQRLAGLHEADRPARAGADLDGALQVTEAVAPRVPRRVGELHGVGHDATVRVHVAHDRARLLELRDVHHLAHLGIAGHDARDDRRLVAQPRVVDEDLEQEAVDLRLGQRVGALGLDRVLGGQHEEGPRDGVGLAAEGDLALLHDLQERGLDLGGRAVDLVGQQQVAEHRAELGGEGAGVGAPDARADEVGRHQVGRELHAAEAAAQCSGQGADGQRLGQAGHALQQHVAAGQQGDEDALEHGVLSHDDALGLVEHGLERLGHAHRVGAGLLAADSRQAGGVGAHRIGTPLGIGREGDATTVGARPSDIDKPVWSPGGPRRVAPGADPRVSLRSRAPRPGARRPPRSARRAGRARRRP